jgi:hypothetical protein
VGLWRSPKTSAISAVCKKALEKTVKGGSPISPEEGRSVTMNNDGAIMKTTELNPLQIVRLSDGPLYFGLAPTQLGEKIKSGEIPEPQYLTATGRARGWTGAQIIEWHKAKDAAQAERAAAAKPARERAAEAAKRKHRNRRAKANA